MDKDAPEIFALSLPSKLGYEKVAMSTAASLAKLMGFSEDRIEDLKTAVGEACINFDRARQPHGWVSESGSDSFGDGDDA